MIRAFLYDAQGHDEEIAAPSGSLPSIEENQLLWLDVVGRDEGDLDELRQLLALPDGVAQELRNPRKSSALNNYGEYFHASVLTLCDPEHAEATLKPPRTVQLDLLVGKNWLATIAKVEIGFLVEFRDQDRGETLIGALSSGALAASLLDWHLTKYLGSLEQLEAFIDDLDVRMLAGRSIDEQLLKQVVAGRRFVARLRRDLGPQRTIFYGLSRPDFALVAETDAAPHFKALEHRFERVIDAIEHARELVQGSFDLFTTRVAETTNVLIRRLTFLSLMLGTIGAVAGIFGMNFQTRFTETGEPGFWIVLIVLLVVVVAAAIVSRARKWI